MSNRTRIKICGITNLEDARAAVDCGADALGFIFVPGTPRYVGESPGALRIPLVLPPFVARVAVYAQAADAFKNSAANFDTIQFYGQEWNPDAHTEKRMVQAFRIRGEESIAEIEAALAKARPHALLLDAYHPDKLGGSGQAFDWEVAKEAKARFGLPVILAGGLTPDNVADAIAAVRPYAVDVSSGVEDRPGHKDHARLQAFCRAVRTVDAALKT
ncbi:MAG TPA: phosphoribosylanthranilate isomerase [Chthonomonadaceae bacterium]|nr:phosphoribosylanthranilate isomerase [Chthonomonadaceae bacterium]